MPICVESKARAARSLIPNERCDRATCTCETRTARTRQRGAHTKRSGSTAIRESTHEDNVARRKKNGHREAREHRSLVRSTPYPRPWTEHRHSAQAQRTGTRSRPAAASLRRALGLALSECGRCFSGIWHYGHTVTSPIRVSRSGRRAAPPRLSPLTAPPDAAVGACSGVRITSTVRPMSSAGAALLGFG